MMRPCGDVESALEELAAKPVTDLPAWAGEHLKTCQACRRRLAAARLARGLVRSAAAAEEPPEAFPGRVVSALRRREAAARSDAELWRPAWGLVPAFGAVVVALFILSQTSLTSEPTSLFSLDSLTTGERIVLGSSAPETDQVLAAVLEGGGR